MDVKKTAGIVLLVIGIVIFVLSLTADLTGIGGNPDVFGRRQIMGTIGGAIVTVVGLILRLRK